MWLQRPLDTVRRWYWRLSGMNNEHTLCLCLSHATVVWSSSPISVASDQRCCCLPLDLFQRILPSRVLDKMFWVLLTRKKLQFPLLGICLKLPIRRHLCRIDSLVLGFILSETQFIVITILKVVDQKLQGIKLNGHHLFCTCTLLNCKSRPDQTQLLLKP